MTTRTRHQNHHKNTGRTLGTMRLFVIGVIAAVLLLPALLAPAQAGSGTPAMITDKTRTEFNKANWMSAGQKNGQPAWLLNCGPSVSCPSLIASPNQFANQDGSLTVCGYNQAYCGQCAVFTQVTSGVGVTSSWNWGAWVLSGSTPNGAVIATFDSSGHYPASGNHAALFVGYNRDSSGRILGFWVVDQNYVATGKVGYHYLQVSGSSPQYQTTTVANGYWQVTT